MANRYERDPEWYDARDRGSFAERYPDLDQWVDGHTWALDIETDLKETVPVFRANLWNYVNRFFEREKRVRTRVLKESGRKILVIQVLDRKKI